jgi:hypothetical protein
MGWSGWRPPDSWPRWPLPMSRLWWLAASDLRRMLSFAIVLLLSMTRLRHGAAGDRYHGALLLAMHADLRGSGHFVRALHEVPVMNILMPCCGRTFGAALVTLLFPARPKVTERYRGLVQFDPDAAAPAAPSANCAAPRAPSISKAARASSPGATTPANAPSADAASKAARTHALSQESACPPIYHNHRRVEEVLHACPQAARSPACIRQPRGKSCAPAAAISNSPASGGTQ